MIWFLWFGVSFCFIYVIVRVVFFVLGCVFVLYVVALFWGMFLFDVYVCVRVLLPLVVVCSVCA